MAFLHFLFLSLVRGWRFVHWGLERGQRVLGSSSGEAHVSLGGGYTFNVSQLGFEYLLETSKRWGRLSLGALSLGVSSLRVGAWSQLV